METVLSRQEEKEAAILWEPVTSIRLLPDRVEIEGPEGLLARYDVPLSQVVVIGPGIATGKRRRRLQAAFIHCPAAEQASVRVENSRKGLLLGIRLSPIRSKARRAAGS